MTAFRGGFVAGARHSNAGHGTGVAVIGWDGAQGTFADGFADQQAGREIAAELLAEGAVAILPIAGLAGAGARAAIEAHGSNAMIRVETDGTGVRQGHTVRVVEA